jgi:hypothetical protein
VRVLDYKTSQIARSPAKVHVTGPHSGHRCEGWPEWRLLPSAGSQPRGWLDLQLPLYVLALRHQFGERIHSGYFLLPAAARETQVIEFDLDPVTLASAQRCANAVIAGIASGHFWPPAALGDYDIDEFESLFFGDVEASLDDETLSAFSAAGCQ